MLKTFWLCLMETKDLNNLSAVFATGNGFWWLSALMWFWAGDGRKIKRAVVREEPPCGTSEQLLIQKLSEEGLKVT